MKTRNLLAAMILCVTLGFAADPAVGTWKLNPAKSKLPGGMPAQVVNEYNQPMLLNHAEIFLDQVQDFL